MELLLRLDGSAGYDRFGHSLDGVGDIDGDGFADLIVGAPDYDYGLQYSTGSAYVYSGATGALLFQFIGAAPLDQLGVSVAGTGDVDGDGTPDLIVGADQVDLGGSIDAGSAYVYSGATGSLLYQLTGGNWKENFGFSVSGAGDVNRDGTPDLIVGAVRADPMGLPDAGSAFVYSGATGSLLYRFDGSGAYESFGWSVSGAGDVDGDGYADLVIGAIHADSSVSSDVGAVLVYSGATGGLMHLWYGPGSGAGFGYSVASAQDVDGDGNSDLIVGAPFLVHPYGLGSAFLYSGATGALLQQYDSTSGSEDLGDSVAGVGDMDGDGNSDVLIGAETSDRGGYSYSGAAYLYSGVTGALLNVWTGETDSSPFGSFVAPAGDVDGDGLPDVAIGSDTSVGFSLSSTDSAFIYSFSAMLETNTDEVSVSHDVLLDFALDYPVAAANYEYRLLLSTTGTDPFSFGVDIPLGLDDWVVRTYFGIYPFRVSQNLQGILDASGDAFAEAGIFAGTFPGSLIGRRLWVAAIASPQGGLPAYSSVARSLTLVP